LFSRANKFSHAATFAINFPKIDEANNLMDIPRIALVCSFNDPRNPAQLLSHGEAETLFHEFGHCLSALLSRTRFQHASGTRSALDFVETPSTLMEHFLWDPRVLKLFAKHHQTGADLPEDVLANLCASQHMFSAIDTQQQLTYSLFDMAVHGPHPLKQSTTEILKDLQNKHTTIPFVDGTYWHARFGHLTGYGAGYYSYLFCRVFSANIWRKCFAMDPLSRQSGERYRRELLQYGGVRDPNKMFEALLGQKPDIDTFLKHIKAS
jgi:intermediate peptidase